MENRYAAFMLRLWQVGDEESASWRASLENAHTGERLSFGNLQALFAFLETCACERTRPNAPASGLVASLDAEQS